MADVKDRVAEHRHRYKLVPVPGEPDTYDLVAIPGAVTEPGTPINRAVFEQINADITGIAQIPWARRMK